MWGKAADAFRARLGDGLSRSGITLPWWAPLGISAFTGLPLVVAIAERDGRPPLAMTAAVLLAAGSAMLWAVTGRIAPSWAKSLAVLASVTVLLAYPVVPDFAPVMLAVLTAEVSAIAAGWLAFVVAAAGIGVLGVASATVGLVGFSVYTLAVLLGLCAGFTLRWYVRALEAERGKQEAVRDQAMLAERQRIAREVHDVVAHSLAMINVQAGVGAHVADRRPEEAKQALLAIKEASRAALVDLRATLGVLRSGEDRAPAPSLARIEELLGSARGAGLSVEVSGDPGELPAPVDSTAYRIVQEALTNTVRHAVDAKNVAVRFERDDGSLTVEVQDDGRPVQAEPGNGVRGMRERALALGGSLWADSRDDGGFVVRAELPI
jgi:signal transduction histidine kinase